MQRMGTARGIKLALASVLLSLLATLPKAAVAQEGFGEEQAQEKQELRQMRNEALDIKSTINSAIDQLTQLKNQAAKSEIKEIHLFAKEADVEISPGTTVHCMTYNGKVPGPPVRVREGEPVRIVVHNQLGTPTSLICQGLALPHNVQGLPRKEAGLVRAGEAFTYQFVAKQSGTYWYHPQVVHSDQKSRGMYGSLVVEPKQGGQSYTRDLVIMLSDVAVTGGAAAAAKPAAGSPFGARSGPAGMAVSAASRPAGAVEYYLFNGKSAPAIPPIELRRGERLRLRVVNAGQHSMPIYLSGHRFEVVAVNGSDALEPHVFRDTITLNPSDRYDLEFTADNPGVWSLASELVEQSTAGGKFPGGIACVVRYGEAGEGDE